jgi:hypothetical protein
MSKREINSTAIFNACLISLRELFQSRQAAIFSNALIHQGEERAGSHE